MLDKVCDTLGLDEVGRDSKILNQAATALHMKSKHVVLAIIAVLAVLLLWPPVQHIVAPIATFVYPAYRSFKALESGSAKNDIRWLTYWIVFGFIHCFDFIL